MGALSCAVIMAKAGKKVLVLEQHDQIGGSLHSFHEKNFEFDTGVHYIGEMKVRDALSLGLAHFQPFLWLKQSLMCATEQYGCPFLVRPDNGGPASVEGRR